MKKQTMTAICSCDVKTVWDIVTDNTNAGWRTDLSRVEVTAKDRFDEYTKNGFVTHFRITAKEPYREYRFSMENRNMSGSWSGLFESCDKGTRVTFTEEVQVRNPIMNLLVKGYLKKQQERYLADLNAEIGRICGFSKRGTENGEKEM